MNFDRYEEDRTPPYSAEAEISVLGAIMIDPDCVGEVRARLRPADFYQQRNREIYRAACDLDDRGEVVDVVTLSERLKDTGRLEPAGGHTYLADILDAVPTSANVTNHAKIVTEKARLRRLIDACSASIRDAYEANGDASSVIDEAERRIFQASEANGVGDGYRRPKEAIFGAMALIEKEGREDGGVTGIPTGIPKLDRMTAGLHAGDVTVLAGRPAMGKSSLAWDVIEHAADRGHSCAISSLEMPEAQLVKRGLSKRARVDLMKIRRGELDSADYEALSKAAGWLHNARIRIDDRTGATVPEIRAKVRRLKSREEVDLVMIDYLQLMDGDGEKRVNQIGSITRGLKRLAREMDVHLLVISQLSRAVERRDPPRPQLSDLRDSGTIEQDADNVLLLWRPEEYFDDETPDERWAKWEGKAELIVGKQRNGPTGRVFLHFDKKTTTFHELTREREGAPAPFS